MRESTVSQTKRLVESLSINERKSFKRYVSFTEEKEGKYLLLFELLSKRKSLKQEQLLKTGKFKNPRNLNSFCKNLQRLIFQALAFDQFGGAFAIESAKIALEKGFIRQAHAILSAELSQTDSNLNPNLFIQLYTELRLLEKHYAVNEKEDLDQYKGRYLKSLEENQNKAQSIHAYQLLRESLKKGRVNSEFLLERFRPLAEQTWDDDQSSRTKYAFLKFKTLWHRLDGDLATSLFFQKKIVAEIDQTPTSYSWEEMLEARSFLATFLIFEEKIEELRKVLLEIGMMNTGNPVREEIIEREWLKSSILGAASGRMPELEKLALKKLHGQSLPQTLSSRWKVILYYYGANIHLCRGEWQEARELTNKITAHSKSLWNNLEWALYLLKSISYIEVGELYLAKTAIEKIDLEEWPQEYIVASKKIIYNLIENGCTIDVYKRSLSFINGVITSFPTEFTFHNIFDFRLWIQSKVQEKSIETLWRSNDSVQSSRFKSLG